MKKTFYFCILLLLLASCVPANTPVSIPTLDADKLNETAVSLATSDYIQTQAQVVVPTQTLAPVHTWTAVATLDRTRPPVHSPTPEQVCNMAAAGHPIDVTIPDGTVMIPGETFSKTWRLENVGRCTWTRQYTVTFFSGNSMDAIQSHFLSAEVEPGEVIDITVDMKAPASSGLYQGNWMLLDPRGDLFGIGPNGDAPFWVQIEVVASITSTPGVTPTVTLTPMVYLTGEVLLNNQDQLDLDTGVINPVNVTEADFLYQQGAEPAHTLSTMNGLEWLVMGETVPRYNECISAEFSEDPLNYQELPIGTYVCFKSSEGLPGWFLFEDFLAGQLSIHFLTWSTAIE